MKFTDQQILDFLHTKNPAANDKDIKAWKVLMREFQCEDSETLEETRDKIVASMDAMLQDLDTPGEGKKAVLARIGRMRLK